MAKMLDLLDSQARQYLTSLNNRSVQVEALNRLLTKNYTADAREALKASGFAEGMLSTRQLHSLIVNKACTWLVDILDGTWVACPLPAQAGLNQAAAIRWFRENGQATAEAISLKKAMKAKAKADAKAEAKNDKAEEPEDVFTQADLDQAFRAGQHDALMSAYAFTASDISRTMLVDLIETLDVADREWLLAELATRYPNASKRAAARKGKGAGNQANLPV